MPTYVYACDSCGSQFERFQSFKDEPLQTFPSCASAVRRVFQPVGIVFKGSGWYVSDYTNRGKAETADGTAAKDSTVESKSDSKTESKAEKSVKTAKADSKDKSGSKDGASSGASSDSKSAPK